jgi:hypothetical protein
MTTVAIALALAALAIVAVLGGTRLLTALRALPAILDDVHDVEDDEDPMDAHAASVLAPPTPVLDYRAVGRVPRVRVEHIAHAACHDRRRWRGQHWHGTGAYLIVGALRDARGESPAGLTVRTHRAVTA